MAGIRGAVLPLLALPLAAAPASGQASPGTDIFIVEIAVRDGALRTGSPVDITDRAGYDNQPYFAPDGRSLLYTSIREDGQAEIYRYDFASRTHSRVTRTAESEYSPTVMPDRRGISVVRVEADSTQRLWRFDLDGIGARLVLPDIRPVGYHAWADENTVALFVLGSPSTLRIADLRTGRAEVIAEDIGRSLHVVPGRGAISFLHRTPDGERWIKEFDPASGATRELVRALDGSEDYAWLPDGSLLMASGSKLFRWDGTAGGGWREVADLADAGLHGITRLAVSPGGDRLALVAERRD